MIAIILLSGCAKVTQEAAPCTGPTPSMPVVNDLVLPAGSETYVTAQAQYGVTLLWKGPNNFVYTGSQLDLNFQNTTNYGTYTVTAFLNGCASSTATFQVSSTLNLPCNISYDGYLNSINETFINSPSFISGYLNQNSAEIYSNTSINGTALTLYISNVFYGNTGSTYSLDSTANFNSGNCYVTIGNYPNTYTSISGKMYMTTYNYSPYLVFCNARFKTRQGTYFNLTGTLPYYN